jgi:ABC-type antimicrobial peptide transport system permease subunit
MLLAMFGGLALLLASIGLYGVANYSVSQRTREIGVRVALGASSGSVLRLVLGQGLALVAAGLLLGVAGALTLSWLVPAGLLQHVSPRDPFTLTTTSLMLTAVALAASCVPAYRATRIDPLVALRTQ